MRGTGGVITGTRSATLGHWRRTMARADNSNIQLRHIGYITVNGKSDSLQIKEMRICQIKINGRVCTKMCR